MLLHVSHLNFEYKSGAPGAAAVRNLSFDVESGEWVAIQGRSGSGKSTLFYLLGGLLRPRSGEIVFEGTDLTRLTADELSLWRNQNIGFVFQQFHLLPRASVLENILLPSIYPAEIKQDRERFRGRAHELAKELGITHRLDAYPNELSGGEQQRVAIARALLTDPKLILADEPTGNLDSQNATQTMGLLRSLHARGRTIILITHDPEIASQCERVLKIQDGSLVGDERISEKKRAPVSLPPQSEPVPRPATAFRFLREILPISLQNLKRNRVRSALTMVGVTVGIAAVFAMTTFGKFTQDQVLKGFEELGVNTLILRGSYNYRRKATDKIDVYFRSFSFEKDLKPLPKVFPEIRLISPLVDSWGTSLMYGGRTIEKESLAWGITAEYHGMSRREVVLGRKLTPFDDENRSPVCLIGPEVRERLFKTEDPIGKILFASSQSGSAYPCRVIGVLSTEASSQQWRKPNLEIYLPYSYYKTVSSFYESEIRHIMIQLNSGEDIERVGKGIKNYFEQRYGLSGDFSVDGDTLMLAQVKKFLGLFTLLISAIALIALGVGAMGINNMMLVSVAERLKEIGLRKALGATNRTIRYQFLLESTSLSIFAGMIGVLLGFSVYQGIIYVASQFVSKIHFEWVVDWRALLFSTLSILAVGILSGLIPAIKAERLSVIESLRNE